MVRSVYIWKVNGSDFWKGVCLCCVYSTLPAFWCGKFNVHKWFRSKHLSIRMRMEEDSAAYGTSLTLLAKQIHSKCLLQFNVDKPTDSNLSYIHCSTESICGNMYAWNWHVHIVIWSQNAWQHFKSNTIENLNGIFGMCFVDSFSVMWVIHRFVWIISNLVLNFVYRIVCETQISWGKI